MEIIKQINQFILTKGDKEYNIGFPSKKTPGSHTFLIIEGCDMTREDEALQALAIVSQVSEATTDVWDGTVIRFKVNGVYRKKEVEDPEKVEKPEEANLPEASLKEINE